MKDKEIEKQAEEIANERCRELMCYGRCNIRKNHHCGYWHYNYECALKGIEYGLAEGRKEVREHETTCVNRLHHIEKENAELKEALNNHPDTASATQLMELIQVREENERLEQEKCELLGIIQAKDEVIAELKAQIEKMENCWNCKFFKEKKYQACIDYKKNNTKCCAFYKWEWEK